MKPITLTESQAQAFMEAVNNPPKANKALKELLRRIKK